MKHSGLTEPDTLRDLKAALLERPGANEVHIYCLSFAPHIGLARRLSDWLSADELNRAVSLCFASCRERFVLSHAYTRSILASYIGVHPRWVPLRIGLYGKPFIAAEATYGGESLGFNLAHCETHAVVAVAPIALVGVDVEQHRLGVDALGIARRYFAWEEAETLSALSLEEVDTHFLRLWTCKEAFVKAIGLGLSYPLDRFVVSGLKHGEPEYSSVEPEYGPPSAWSLRTWALAPNCYVAVTVKLPKAVVIHVRGSLWSADVWTEPGRADGRWRPD